MTFSEFAQMLFKYYDCNEDDTPNRKKSKAQFTRKLLLGGLKTETVEYIETYDFISDLTDSAIRNYFNGDRQVFDVMFRLKPAFRKSIFIKFIRDEFEVHFKAISKDLADNDIHCPPNKVPSKLTEIYIDILNQESKKTAKRKTPRRSPQESAVESSQTTQSIQPTMLQKDREKIADIILELSTLFEIICDPSSNAEANITTISQNDWITNAMIESVFSTPSPDTKENEEIKKVCRLSLIEKKLADFKEENQKLCAFCKRYSTYTMLKELYKTGCNLNAEMFLQAYLLNNAEQISEEAVQYRDLLDSCTQDIVTLNSLQNSNQ